jgi:hypothetical protein
MFERCVVGSGRAEDVLIKREPFDLAKSLRLSLKISGNQLNHLFIVVKHVPPASKPL